MRNNTRTVIGRKYDCQQQDERHGKLLAVMSGVIQSRWSCHRLALRLQRVPALCSHRRPELAMKIKPCRRKVGKSNTSIMLGDCCHLLPEPSRRAFE